MSIDWDTIGKDFCSGVPLLEIAKRYGVTMGELFAMAKERGWKRPTPPETEKPGAGPEPANIVQLPVTVDAKTRETVEAVAADVVAGVVEDHKAITAELRRQLKRDLAEYDSMNEFFASFQDREHISKLVAQDDDGAGLRAYLQQCLDHTEQRGNVSARIVQSASRTIELERAVWGLDREGGGVKEQTYDDALEELQKPLGPPTQLPPNALRFEKAINRKP